MIVTWRQLKNLTAKMTEKQLDYAVNARIICYAEFDVNGNKRNDATIYEDKSGLSEIIKKFLEGD